jgi:ATP-dependent helicase HrpB
MMLSAERMGLRGLACDLAALLSERDILRARPGFRDADLRLRIEALRSGKGHDGLEVDRGAMARVRELSKDGRGRLRLPAGVEAGTSNDVGLVAAFAYPDRIAKRRGGEGFRFQLSGGGGAVFSGNEPLAAQDYLVIPELDGDRREAKIFLAAPLSLAEIEENFADQIRWSDQVRWDRREQTVTQASQRMLGTLVLAERRLTKVDPAKLVQAMIDGVRDLGLACLPWSKDTQSWCERLRLLAKLMPEENWPDMSEAGLLATLETWLAPFLSGVTRKSHLDGVDLRQALESTLDWQQKQRLDELVPTHVTVPTGNRIALDYSGDKPVLAVRLQEMFGCAQTPAIANGRMPVLLHLLSPARRPLQVTDDLAGFWANTYHAVKAEMKGQYPRHWWPDDPMQAEPTARAKPRSK